MTDTEVEGVVLSYFFRKKDKLTEELKSLEENLEVLQGAIDHVTTHGTGDPFPHTHEWQASALSSMYMDRERIRTNILDKQIAIKCVEDIISGVNKGD